MRNCKWTMGDLGASTRPISFAPAIKSNKDRLLMKFKNKLGAKGYTPAQAQALALKVRAEANALAAEVNARQGNDDPVRMANIHTLALKQIIKKTLIASPSKRTMGEDGLMGKISKTSPMAVSVSGQGKAYDTHIVKNRARRRDAKKAEKIYDAAMTKKMRGIMKDEILREAQRAAYMQQFNGGLGHYYGGTMGLSFKKPAFVAKVQKTAAKVAAPVAKVAAKVAAPVVNVASVALKPVAQGVKYTAQSAVRAADIIRKDPIAALTKVAIAPVTLAASTFPPHTIVGKAARKIEEKSIKFVKAAVSLIQKVIKIIWDKIIVGAWELIKKALGYVYDWFKKLVEDLKQRVWDKFSSDGSFSGMGEMGINKDEEMKYLEKSVTKTANRLKAKGEGDFQSGLKTYALKDFSYGAGSVAGAAAVETKIGVDALKAIIKSAATGGGATVGEAAQLSIKAAGYYSAAAVPVTAKRVAADGSKEIGGKVIENIKDIAFDEACRDYAQDIASRKIKNPIARAVTTEAINGDLTGKMEKVQAVATGIADPVKRQEFINKAQSLPEEKRVELMKQVAIPSELKPMVKNLDNQTEQIAAKINATKDKTESVADFANKLGQKNVPQLPPEAIAAIKEEGKIVQDKVAISQVNKGELTKSEGIIAMSSIGQKAVINSLPPEKRAVVIEEIKSERPLVLDKAEEKKAEQKKAQTATILTAAAIAAKVLLF